ncbi:hypothetical protein BHE74_00014100 [Ensete ventricosum]|nr:hypothetical protein BHE74_00014100 [Ensete ventricosum]
MSNDPRRFHCQSPLQLLVDFAATLRGPATVALGCVAISLHCRCCTSVVPSSPTRRSDCSRTIASQRPQRVVTLPAPPLRCNLLAAQSLSLPSAPPNAFFLLCSQLQPSVINNSYRSLAPWPLAIPRRSFLAERHHCCLPTAGNNDSHSHTPHSHSTTTTPQNTCTVSSSPLARIAAASLCNPPPSPAFDRHHRCFLPCSRSHHQCSAPPLSSFPYCTANRSHRQASLPARRCQPRPQRSLAAISLLCFKRHFLPLRPLFQRSAPPLPPPPSHLIVVAPSRAIASAFQPRPSAFCCNNLAFTAALQPSILHATTTALPALASN